MLDADMFLVHLTPIFPLEVSFSPVQLFLWFLNVASVESILPQLSAEKILHRRLTVASFAMNGNPGCLYVVTLAFRTVEDAFRRFHVSNQGAVNNLSLSGDGVVIFPFVLVFHTFMECLLHIFFSLWQDPPLL